LLVRWNFRWRWYSAKDWTSIESRAMVISVRSRHVHGQRLRPVRNDDVFVPMIVAVGRRENDCTENGDELD
jgi:hypothetical protein